MKLQYNNNRQYEPGFGDILMGQVGGAVGSLAGLALQPLVNQEQLSQQQALTNMQVKANEDVSAYNFGQQLQFWNQTNYPEQVNQLNEAGLNPALLYAKGGTGGTTGTPSGGIGMGIAPGQTPAQTTQAMQAAAQTQADIDLKEAQAKNIEAQTPQEADLMKTQIASITQGISNSQAQQALTQMQTITQGITNTIQGQTSDDQIASIRAAATQIESTAQQAVRNNYMDQNTMDTKIKTIQGIMIGTYLQNQLTQTQTNLQKEQITQIVNNISQNWQNIGINKQNANTNEGQLKLQQLIKDIPDSNGIILKGLTKLIPSLVIGL